MNPKLRALRDRIAAGERALFEATTALAFLDVSDELACLEADDRVNVAKRDLLHVYREAWAALSGGELEAVRSAEAE